MKQFLGLTTYNKINIGLILLIIAGLFLSRALISIASSLMLVNVFLHLYFFSSKMFFNKKVISLILIVLPILSLLNIFFAENKSDIFTATFHKLPLFVLPISIFLMELKKKQTYFICLTFLFFSVISSIVVLLNYLGDFAFYNQQLQQGIPFPTPNNDHVRYSIMIAFSAIVSMFSAMKGKSKFLLLFTGIYLIFFIHLLSVRIGILTLYLGIFLMILYLLYIYNYRLLAFSFFLILFSLPIVSYQFIPSFKSRINYMKYDWEEFKSGNYGHNSDSRRLLSLKIGWQLIKEKPIIGFGPNKINQAVEQYYTDYFPEIEPHNRKLPHNQILFTWLELGIFSVTALLLVFFVPIFYYPFKENFLLYAIIIIIFTSLIFDNTLETQLGMTFFAVFFSILSNGKVLE